MKESLILKDISEGYYWINVIRFHQDFDRVRVKPTIGKYDENGFWKIIGSDVSHQTFKKGDILGHYEIKICPLQKIVDLKIVMKEKWRRKHTNYSTIYMRKRRKEARQKGMCVRCLRRKAIKNFALCRVCRDDDNVRTVHNKYMKDKRKKSKEEGICCKCFKEKANNGMIVCDKCYKKANHLVYMRERRLKFRKKGICDRCFKRKVQKDKYQCSLCRTEINCK